MRVFLPQFEGSLGVTGIPDDFTARLAARVRTGLIVPGDRRRAAYEVESLSANRIAFRAANMATAIAVGLNEVVVERQKIGILYRARYWKWTLYCASLGASLFVLLIAFGLFGVIPMGQSFRGFWLYFHAVFWGLVWPWLLTALHKRFAAKCLEHILLEVAQQAHGERAASS
jgi:hypothetical protein